MKSWIKMLIPLMAMNLAHSAPTDCPPVSQLAKIEITEVIPLHPSQYTVYGKLNSGNKEWHSHSDLIKALSSDSAGYLFTNTVKHGEPKQGCKNKDTQRKLNPKYSK